MTVAQILGAENSGFRALFKTMKKNEEDIIIIRNQNQDDLVELFAKIKECNFSTGGAGARRGGLLIPA